ncbi:DUF4868 domain-containing protein [Clostridium neonatale]|uniref:DUF4868 domain-containing protein n=1 Tax=Clostridium neonatale TaxID=137838 RepID=UPI00291BE490|nr:DUF4868 domain-containing protein [Clostridium neonatale]CAI3654989.1 conserved hypothetical protein [Clostridium neonatale]CAI3721875.1 conserved hypothetical protein [Clostridium neonatale]
MSKQEFSNVINSIINQNISYGLKVFTCVKEENSDDIKVKNFNMLDPLQDNIKNLIVDVIQQQYLAEDIEFDKITNIADNRKIIYELEQDDKYRPFAFLNNINLNEEYFSNDDTDKLIGFIFKFNLNSNNIFVYQQAYSGTRIKNKNVLHVVKRATDKFDIFDKELLRIDKRAEIIILNDVLYVKNINVLQEKFKFQKYVRGEAKKVINKINELDIVTNIDKIKDCESEERLTSSKKIMKLKNSPVLTIDKEDLINRLTTIEKYKNIINIVNGKIKTDTKKDVGKVLKILNDDYLKSELTEVDYDSSIKKQVI